MEVILIRHGETDANKQKVFQGATLNYNLNFKGQLQAKKLADTLAKEQIDAIYSSPLNRAIQTATPLAKDKQLSLIIDNRLIENNLGKIEGLSKKIVKKEYPDEYRNWRDLTLLDYAFTGGESKQQVANRFIDFLKEAEQQGNKRIAIVTHAGAIRALLASQGIQQTKIPNTCIIKIIFKQGKLYPI